MAAPTLEAMMAAGFMLVIDCADPDRLARFWAAALGYVIEPPPVGWASWDDYWRSIGVPEEDLGIGVDRIMDPEGRGPRIWFQVVPERKTVKNRLHLDIHASGDEPHASPWGKIPLEVRKQRVDAEASRLAALGATVVAVLSTDGLDHYAIAMRDPEGNEFDIN
jgi:glyoxalase superfamily protein